MCGSMVDIQSPTAEIRRGKKKKERRIETTGRKYNGLPYYIGQTITTEMSKLTDRHVHVHRESGNNYSKHTTRKTTNRNTPTPPVE